MSEKPREFWVSVGEPTMSMNNRHKLYTASEIPSDRDWLHVIEYSAFLEQYELHKKYWEKYAALEKECAELKLENDTCSKQLSNSFFEKKKLVDKNIALKDLLRECLEPLETSGYFDLEDKIKKALGE